MYNKKPVIFFKTIYGIITVIVLSCFGIIRGTKTEKEFDKVSGKITYIGKHYKELPNRNFGKYRYIKLDVSEQIFEIFIGKDFGDFKPSFEKIDGLKVDDTINIYFDIDPSETENINRLVQFIFKNEVPYFKRGSIDKYIGITLLAIGILSFLLLAILKYKDKID
ncbi:MAG: hypothetical protein REI64_16515 [Pedobacter sp.]|uniref:hypothetical protein n=1 Tax=Pedobacter sp. TaxID=1411316 RepID=UPI002806E31F|nr:hypothetical protein [Pedobacter sp.]MDQ8006408.1 hypothetical protein [Pedobacter sp.]